MSAGKNYIDEIVIELRKEFKMVQPNPVPDALLYNYALVALLKGTSATLEDTHDAWCAWCAASQEPEIPHNKINEFQFVGDETKEVNAAANVVIYKVSLGLDRWS